MNCRLAGLPELTTAYDAARAWSSRAAEVVELFAGADATRQPLPQVENLLALHRRGFLLTIVRGTRRLPSTPAGAALRRSSWACCRSLFMSLPPRAADVLHLPLINVHPPQPAKAIKRGSIACNISSKLLQHPGRARGLGRFSRVHPRGPEAARRRRRAGAAAGALSLLPVSSSKPHMHRAYPQHRAVHALSRLHPPKRPISRHT